MFLLKPDKETNDLILFWLAKAKVKYGSDIELYAFVFMSNHYHMLLRDPQGQLSKFMWYFQGNLARSINSNINRLGKFWHREYDDVIVDGEDEFWNRYAYTVLNPVKTGLVDQINQWGGHCSHDYFINDKPVIATGINANSYHEAKRFNPKVDTKEFEEIYKFNIETPASLIELSADKKVKHITELLQSAKVQYKNDRENKSALGMNKILSIKHLDRPENPKKSPRFKFFSNNKERLKELKENYYEFIGYYKECVALYYNQINSKSNIITKIWWPQGCYPPTCNIPKMAANET
jgi:REP element-mobilizing transposase RayT